MEVYHEESVELEKVIGLTYNHYLNGRGKGVKEFYTMWCPVGYFQNWIEKTPYELLDERMIEGVKTYTIWLGGKENGINV